MYDELELDKLGDRKTALFLIMSDTDSTFNFLISMIYTQLFNLLCDKADDVYGGKLPVHVRCLIDECANIGQIPQLEKLVAQGKVHKLLTEEGACYQYCDKDRPTDCFLLQCEGCGTIFHMDCSHLGELYDHLLEGHGFAINPRRTMFYGLCREGREAKK